MNIEMHKLYDYTQTVIEKYKDVPKEKLQSQLTDEEMIAIIFDQYLNDAGEEKLRAKNLIQNALVFFGHVVENLADKNIEEYSKYSKERTQRQKKMYDFIQLLLQNDPTLYSQLVHTFFELKDEGNISEELLLWLKKEIDKIQITVKIKDYQTPFYNVVQKKEGE